MQEEQLCRRSGCLGGVARQLEPLCRSGCEGGAALQKERLCRRSGWTGGADVQQEEL